MCDNGKINGKYIQQYPAKQDDFIRTSDIQTTGKVQHYMQNHIHIVKKKNVYFVEKYVLWVKTTTGIPLRDFCVWYSRDE